MKTSRRGRVVPVLLAAAGLSTPAALAGEHTWDVWEVFSNADRSVQFIELREANGGTGEFGVNGNTIRANPSNTTYVIPNPALTGNTAGKSFLIATQGFADLPGAPT